MVLVKHLGIDSYDPTSLLGVTIEVLKGHTTMADCIVMEKCSLILDRTNHCLGNIHIYLHKKITVTITVRIKFFVAENFIDIQLWAQNLPILKIIVSTFYCRYKQLCCLKLVPTAVSAVATLW